MPVILATQEAEMRRIRGLKPAWANSSRDPNLKKEKKNQKNGLVGWLKV
jgi:hypothetical protein